VQLCGFLQVNYNITATYITKHGVREFSDQVVKLHNPTHLELPLYTKNTTYSIQVTAITSGGERIDSMVKILNSLHFSRSGMDGKATCSVVRISRVVQTTDAITYMQLRLLTPVECSAWLNMVSWVCKFCLNGH